MSASDELVCRKGDDIRVVTVLFEIMTIAAILPFWAWLFLHEPRGKFILQARLGEGTLDRIDIDGPSLGNSDTEFLFW